MSIFTRLRGSGLPRGRVFHAKGIRIMSNNVLEVWSLKGSTTATANVLSAVVSEQDMQSMAGTLRRLVEAGVKQIVIGFGRVQTLSIDAIDTLNRFHADVSTGEVRLSLFGLNGQLESLKTSIKVPVYNSEEIAQRANLVQAL